MSRIGRKEIPVPKGVEVKHDGNVVTVKGPKGTLTTSVIPGIGVSIENNVVQFTRSNDEGRSRAFHGLMRALVANNVREYPTAGAVPLVTGGVAPDAAPVAGTAMPVLWPAPVAVPGAVPPDAACIEDTKRRANSQGLISVLVLTS